MDTRLGRLLTVGFVVMAIVGGVGIGWLAHDLRDAEQDVRRIEVNHGNRLHKLEFLVGRLKNTVDKCQLQSESSEPPAVVEEEDIGTADVVPVDLR